MKAVKPVQAEQAAAGEKDLKAEAAHKLSRWRYKLNVKNKSGQEALAGCHPILAPSGHP